jgi:uncharacterized GH25 family protein
MRLHLLVGLASALLFSTAAHGHDYWLEPDSFFPAPDSNVAVHLHVGDKFVSEEERPFQKKPTLRFQLIAGKETVDLAALGQEDKTPVARAAVKVTGTYLVAMERDVQRIKLDAEKFNKYLAEEGLEAILEQRRKAGEDKSAGKERYTRYLKCLLQAGDARTETWKRELGQKLEIIPEANPYDLKADAKWTIHVVFDGKPLANAKVSVHRRSKDETTTQTATTSKEGQATFLLEGEGAYLVRLVHMRRCTGDDEADWESFWSALTFGMK